MTVSCSLDDTFKFNCATYDTPDAVKMFSQIWDFFLFSDFTSMKMFYLEKFVAYHMPFFKNGETVCQSSFFLLFFFDKDKILSGVRLD